MKSTKKVTRLRLESSHEDELALLGLVSADPDYRLSLAINRKLGISLKSTDPITPSETKDCTFSRFMHSGDMSASFSLVSNKCGKTLLIRKLKNVDYIFWINDPENEYDVTKLSLRLREIDSITAVFNIEINSLKDRNIHYLIQ